MVLFGIFLALVLLGLPVAFSFVVGGLFYQSLFTSVNPNLIASTTYGGIDSFSLLAIPFFIFAGDIMLKGGVSKRLVDFAKLFLRIRSVRSVPSVWWPAPSSGLFPAPRLLRWRQSAA